MSAITIIESIIIAHKSDERKITEAQSQLINKKIDRLSEAIKAIATIPGSVERQIYSQQLAETFGISLDAIKREVENKRRQMLLKAKEESRNIINE